jgi:hypothetical protein
MQFLKPVARADLSMSNSANKKARRAATRTGLKMDLNNESLTPPQNQFCNYKNLSSTTTQIAIRAELIGSDCCAVLGMTERGMTPVLALCRRLIEAGHDPATPLEVWRGSTLCLRIRRIGEAAQLEPSPRGVGFVRGGPPVAQTARILPPTSGTTEPPHEAARQSSKAAIQAARRTPLAR